MKFRTPINTIKHPTKRWKTSPPPARKGFPLQYNRPRTAVQQARGPPLELLHPSPVSLRFDDAALSPPKVASKPKYMKEVLDSNLTEEGKSGVKPNSKRQQPISAFGWFSLVVLAVASLHLIHFGNRNVERMRFTSARSGKNILFNDKDSFLRSSHRDLAEGQAPPRIFFLGKHPHLEASAFQSASGRKVELFPTEFSDVTQIYGLKSSDDTAIVASMERKFFPTHETNPDCVPMSQWQTKSFPTCNSFHEMGLVPSLYDQSLRLLSGAGSWRDAWRFKAYVAPSDKRRTLDNVVVKTIKFEHTFQERYFEFSRVDALAMERLTSNPYVMGVHGFCGVSVITERGTDAVGHVADHLTSRSKVDLARKVAKSIAAVHEIDGRDTDVSLLHNDLTVDNVFWGNKGPLLNDFNIAVLMMKDKHTGESCPFPGHYPNPQWKSPEEQAGPDGNSIGSLTEKVDVYGLGNLLFRFATGTGPWRDFASDTRAKLTDEQKQHIARLKVEEGKLPAVPERILKRKDPYINLLLEAMKMCYRFKPEDRPSAREVAEYLEEGKRRVELDHVEFGRMIKH